MDSKHDATDSRSQEDMANQHKKAPQHLFDFYGVPGDTPWGEIIRDCYFGTCKLTPAECKQVITLPRNIT